MKLQDFLNSGPIAQQHSDIDVTENQSVSYTLENIDAAKQKAVQDAYQRAHASAETIAQAGGRTLSELQYASVDTFEQIRVLAGEARAMGAVRTMAAAEAA